MIEPERAKAILDLQRGGDAADAIARGVREQPRLKAINVPAGPGASGMTTSRGQGRPHRDHDLREGGRTPRLQQSRMLLLVDAGYHDVKNVRGGSARTAEGLPTEPRRVRSSFPAGAASGKDGGRGACRRARHPARAHRSHRDHPGRESSSPSRGLDGAFVYAGSTLFPGGFAQNASARGCCWRAGAAFYGVHHSTRRAVILTIGCPRAAAKASVTIDDIVVHRPDGTRVFVRRRRTARSATTAGTVEQVVVAFRYTRRGQQRRDLAPTRSAPDAPARARSDHSPRTIGAGS